MEKPAICKKPAICRNVPANFGRPKNVSRQKLLQWLYDTFGHKVPKVESLCSGAIYCQLMNILFPASLPLSKIKFEATTEYEYQANFKQLQLALKAVGCDKPVPIQKLIKGRFQDNFEFLEWFKRFFEFNSSHNYLVPDPKIYPKQSYELPGPSGISCHTSTPKPPKDTEKELHSKLFDLNNTAEQLEMEKQFYLNKLENIKGICNAALDGASSEDEKKTHLANKMLAILDRNSDDDKNEGEDVDKNEGEDVDKNEGEDVDKNEGEDVEDEEETF